MRLILFCVFGIASYALGEEPVEHRSSADEPQIVKRYSLASSGLFPMVPVVATPYAGFGGGFGFPGQGGLQGLIGGIQGLIPGQGQGGYPGGYPHNNNPYPGQGGYPQGGSSSCRYWCRSPQNQYYCCEGQNQQIGGGQVGTKQGFCPPVRPSCPPTRIHGPPRQCSNDYACTGVDKCCFDTCLQHHTCKPPQGYGR